MWACRLGWIVKDEFLRVRKQCFEMLLRDLSGATEEECSRGSLSLVRDLIPGTCLLARQDSKPVDMAYGEGGGCEWWKVRW